MSCFLPLYRLPGVSGITFTLFSQIVGPSSGPIGTKLGGAVFLFGGAVTVAVISIVGVRGRSHRWALAALVGAVVTWSLTSIGFLIHIGTSFGVSPRWGYWVLLSSFACVVAGAVIVMVFAKAETTIDPSGAPLRM
ncbi:MAG: hypothetical protein ABI595_09230 [Actinomycetota bacterium]